MSPHLPPAADIEAGIHTALGNRDMPAVAALLRLLAVQDPIRAELVYQTLRVGLAIADETKENDI